MEQPSQIEMSGVLAWGSSWTRAQHKNISKDRRAEYRKLKEKVHGYLVLRCDEEPAEGRESSRAFVQYVYTALGDMYKILQPCPWGERSHAANVLLGEPMKPESEGRLMENEILKTQLIAEQRYSLVLQAHNDELSSRHADDRSEHGALVEAVCNLSKANKALQSALISQTVGRVCFHETHRGAVTEVLENQVEVTYDTTAGPLKQIYDRSQFMHGKMPSEGQTIETHVMMVVASKIENQKQPEDEIDLPDFTGKGVTGTIRI